MAQPEISSAAFSGEHLRSERYRIIGVLGFLTFFLILTLVRVFIVQTVSRSAPWTWSIALTGALIVYELLTLRYVDLALKANRTLPSSFWIISTIVETSIPAFGMVLSANPEIEAAYRPLAAPALLAFSIFIVLSTLRLTAWISYLSGIVASISYLGAAVYLGWRPPVPGVAAPATQTMVSLNAIALLCSGVVAGLVARQIRKHVTAALREAETQKKLELVQHDLEVARSIQQSLLPKEKPEIDGMDLAGWNKSADDTSGDYFDWIKSPDGRVTTTLADVTGHGIGPALLATTCRAYARAVLGTQLDLTSAMTSLNERLSCDLPTGRFITFAATTCIPGTGDAEILSAGHGPILIYSRQNDSFQKINGQGLPLGILPVFNADAPLKLQLRAGDLILLITDGFYEWENQLGEDFGVQRLEQVIRESRDCDSAQIIAKLYESVLAFSNGTSQQDDLTAIVMKRV